jgi:hypothetical protein
MRATDQRDGVAQAALFAPGGAIQVWSRSSDGEYVAAAPEFLAEDIAAVVAKVIGPHAPGSFSHHVTMDHLITVAGREAHLSAQFIVYEVRPAPEPPVRPSESGYYEMDLVLTEDGWRIARSDVMMDLPAS